MLPLNTAQEVLASTTPTANTVFSAFSQYAWLEIGVVIGVLILIFIIGIFTHAVERLVNFARHGSFLTNDEGAKKFGYTFDGKRRTGITWDD